MMAPATKGSSLGGASFRSAVSATSYRSCVSHASFRSCVSSVYHECGGSPSSGRHETFHSNHSNDAFHSLAGHSNEGFQSSLDNVSYYSVTDSLAADVPSLPAISAAAAPSNPLSAPDKDVEKEPGGEGGSVYLGYAFAVLAGVSFTASTFVSSHLPLVDPWLLLLVRCVLQLALVSIFMACTRLNPLGPNKGRWKLPLQSLISGVLIVAIYLSATRLPSRDASCLYLLTPLVAVLLSTCLLRDRCGLYRCLSSILVAVGVLLLARPGGLWGTRGLFEGTSSGEDLSSSLVQINIYGWPVHFNNATYGTSFPVASWTNQSRGVHVVKGGGEGGVHVVKGGGEGGLDVLGMLAAIAVPLMSAYLLVLISSCRSVHCCVLVAWSSVGPLVVAVVGLLTLGGGGVLSLGGGGVLEGPHEGMEGPKQWLELEGPQQWLLMLAVAALGMTGNLLMTKAVEWVAPSRVAILLQSSVVAAYVLHICVYRLVPVLWDCGGVGLVLLALLATAVENILRNKCGIKWL